MTRRLLLAIGRAYLWLTTPAPQPTESEFDTFDDGFGGGLLE